MEKLTNDDIKNIIALIQLSQIKGSEATTVALLQQKLNTMLTETTAPVIPEVETKKK